MMKLEIYKTIAALKWYISLDSDKCAREEADRTSGKERAEKNIWASEERWHLEKENKPRVEEPVPWARFSGEDKQTVLG